MKYQISKYFNTISKCIWQKEQLYKSSPYPLGNLGILLCCSWVMTVDSETAYFVNNMMNSTLISCQVEEGKSIFSINVRLVMKTYICTLILKIEPFLHCRFLGGRFSMAYNQSICNYLQHNNDCITTIALQYCSP